MDIEIKKSIKPVNYFEAIDLLESRLKNIADYKEKDVIEVYRIIETERRI